jgi:hypothetical protein
VTARIDLKDLPPALRRKIAGQAQTVSRPSLRLPAGTATGRVRGSTPPRWRCHTCGQLFTAWAPAERHPHPRIELLLPDAALSADQDGGR